MCCEILSNPCQQLATDVLVHELTAAITQRYLGLITLGKKAKDATHFYLVVRLFSPGTKLDFLYLNLLLLTLRGVRLLVLLEQELAEIHDPDYRWLRHRGDFNQIQCL